MKKAALPFVLLLAACALTPPEFDRGGRSSEEMRADDYVCERDARSVRGGSCTQVNMYAKCMSAKGYRPIDGTGNSYWRCWTP